LALRSYILRRVAYMLLLLLLVVTLNFIIFRLAPSDPLTTIVSGSRLRPEQIEILKKRFHIGEPLLTQYIYYLSNLVQGEFGYSYRTQRAIALEIAEVLPNTLLLLGMSTIISIIIGIALGIVAAARRGRLADISILFLGMTFYALPTFWIGLLLLLLLGFTFPIFPLKGTVSLPAPVSALPLMLDVLWHLTLPALTLVLHLFAEYTVITRNSILGVLTEDYIVTARAKGLDEKTVLLRYALKNAMLPMVTLIALGFGGIMGGAIIAETVFSWQGIGQYLWTAIEVSDYPVMQAVFFVVAVATIIANFAADLLYGFLDPRIKLGG